jgi:hypothetical protein
MLPVLISVTNSFTSSAAIGFFSEAMRARKNRRYCRASEEKASVSLTSSTGPSLPNRSRIRTLLTLPDTATLYSGKDSEQYRQKVSVVKSPGRHNGASCVIASWPPKETANHERDPNHNPSDGDQEPSRVVTRPRLFCPNLHPGDYHTDHERRYQNPGSNIKNKGHNPSRQQAD